MELKVPVDSMRCNDKIKKTVPKIPGVTDVKIDVSQEKLTVKGNGIDANMIVSQILEKTGKATNIWIKGNRQP